LRSPFSYIDEKENSNNEKTIESVCNVLGIVIIGGMVTSTLNSFVVIPIIYEWMQGKKAKVENSLSV
jgi:mannose/fructose/N-acetylgalactosamine-specific phosphotransferase system component IID